MDKKEALIIILISLFCLATTSFLIRRFIVSTKLTAGLNNNQAANIINQETNTAPLKEDIEVEISNKVAEPISQALTRITKKPFGIKISPTDSPVSPEKFSGYHTGSDFETTTAEKDINVPVLAICDGPIILKRMATGYGGVVVQSCQINNQDVTVVYGHLRLVSITSKINESLKAGEQIGFLGTGYSTETDGERKHLHLSIHLGSDINIRGYVDQVGELQAWLDPLTLLQNN